ncbi:Esterase/lipase superfamily enzyme [Rhizobium sp. NFR07]|nr:Esterase/lipase superfamily enzyme [Rhizobium sp. NFR07]
MKALIACIIVLALAGCGHPTGVMTPIAVTAATPKTPRVEMLVATTREPSGNRATLFTGERSPRAHLTEIVVSLPPGRKAGEVQWPQRLPPDPAADFAVTRVSEIDTIQAGRAWVRQHLIAGHALVFVHGFNNKYEDSVFRLAQIVHDSGMQATPVLFTWPSRAKLRDYEYDKESTNYSRTALEQTLRILAQDPSVKEITVLGHSMGTWLTMEALRQMGIRDGHVNGKIRNVILASPDIDIQVFAKQFVEMGKPAPKFTIFVSQDDRALAFSSLITGKVSRLGAIDPSREPYRSRLDEAGITAIDLTQVKTGDNLNHGKFAESPEVVQLIGQRLMTGQTLTDSTISLGDGVAAVVGGTARTVGAAAAAPLAIAEQSVAQPSTTDVSQTLQADPQSRPVAY